MTLGDKQELFSECLGKLLVHIYSQGYQVRMGDVWAKKRNPLEHKANSQHYLKLAADLNLFKDGRFLMASFDHAEFGAFWETLSPLCRWGGRYNDGNHYEVT